MSKIQIKTVEPPGFRPAIIEYIQSQAQPPDKFAHQPRLYALAKRLSNSQPYDDDVLFAAAWLHDLGVFVGHRPQNPAELASWDHIAYAQDRLPALLEDWGFPSAKIPQVLEVIRTHLPSGQPTSFEGTLLRDADLLEQLGAVGIVRTVSKVGRDTRFTTHRDAILALQKTARELPPLLRLPQARELGLQRAAFLEAFLAAFERDSQES